MQCIVGPLKVANRHPPPAWRYTSAAWMFLSRREQLDLALYIVQGIDLLLPLRC